MFQYTHELVLNNPVIKKVDNKVVIERGGEYDPNKIQGGKIYKTVAVEGKRDKVELDVTALNLEAGKNYYLSFFVKLVDPHALFEYGYPNYKNFGKQVLVDFESAGDAEKDAKMILDSILPQVMENDLSFVKGEVDGGKVVLEVGHDGLRFDSVAFAEYDTTACDSCIGEYLAPEVILDHADWESEDENAVGLSKHGDAIKHVVPGKDAFATGQWLIENLRFPSYPHIRYNAIGKGDYPIPSEKYVMYSFAYESPRPGLGGLSGVGQVMAAVTRHIYYVPEGKVAAFEAVLAELGSIEDSADYAE